MSLLVWHSSHPLAGASPQVGEMVRVPETKPAEVKEGIGERNGSEQQGFDIDNIVQLPSVGFMIQMLIAGMYLWAEMRFL